MAVPKYQETYASILTLLKDGKEHPTNELRDFVATDMNISDEERKEMIQSGSTTRLNSNVGWAITYLKKAGLVESPARSIFKLSKEGQKVLKAHKPSEINDQFMKRYDSFNKFYYTTPPKNSASTITTKDETPEGSIESAVRQINDRLSDDLLMEIMKQDPAFFEDLVVKLLTAMGYGGTDKDAGMVTGKSGDGGIDGIIKEDKLGLSHIYIQAKRWDINTSISRPEIQKFVGAIDEKSKGVFITTAKFTKESEEYAKSKKIVLINGVKLAELMIEYNVGVTTQNTYAIKRVDTDFFNYEI